VFTDDWARLHDIRKPGVVAVVFVPPARPPWLAELADAIERGDVAIPRSVHDSLTRAQVHDWLGATLTSNRLSARVRRGLLSDVASLLDLEAALTGTARFNVRAFVESPTRRCGMHVDTTMPGRPRIGVLRVYNGEGTDFVEPSNVASMASFFTFLSHRERLGRELAGATAERSDRYRALFEEILDLDARPPFLADPERILRTPPGAIVSFKHLDLRDHWSAEAVDSAWIHSSPVEGGPRLVVNITPGGGSPREGRP
jgi:hypothetical protein